MTPPANPIRRYPTQLCAIALVALVFAITRQPYLRPSEAEIAAMTSRFHFERMPLAETGDPATYKHIRAVHPSLTRIDAWISSLGAAVTLADLHGDGLPTDLILSDPRTNLVTIQPVPGTPRKCAPFATIKT